MTNIRLDKSVMLSTGFSRNHGDSENGTTFKRCEDREYYGGLYALDNSETKTLTLTKSNLSPHNLVQIRFVFGRIGTWSEKTFQVSLDSKIVYKRTFTSELA